MKLRSINIFLLDDDPNGIRVAQIPMSTVQAIAFRRHKPRPSRDGYGLENIGPERPLPCLLAVGAVLSPSRITLESNGKIRSLPDRERAFARASGRKQEFEIDVALWGSIFTAVLIEAETVSKSCPPQAPLSA